MPRLKAKYHLKIPSQTDNLEIIREFVSNIANKAGFNSEDVDKIELAVDEACSNVIKHAYDGDEKKSIDIDVKIEKNKLIIFVTDKGKGFNIGEYKPPDMNKYMEEKRVGGLGIYLIKNLMDEVEFNINPGVKTQVKLVKFLTQNRVKEKI